MSNLNKTDRQNILHWWSQISWCKKYEFRNKSGLHKNSLIENLTYTQIEQIWRTVKN